MTIASHTRITTVITAAEDFDLVTLAFVKSALNKTTVTDDAYLETLISSASSSAAQYCNRVFVVETVKDEFWPRRDCSPVRGGLAPLQLSRLPIKASGVTSVVENSVTLVDGTDFRVDYELGQLVRLDSNGYPTRWPVYAIAVTYSAGFDEIPADIQDAVARMVTSRFLARGRDANLRQESIPGVREVQYWVPDTPTGNMSPDIADILDNYRVAVIA